jgi:hypothetical protein
MSRKRVKKILPLTDQIRNYALFLENKLDRELNMISKKTFNVSFRPEIRAQAEDDFIQTYRVRSGVSLEKLRNQQIRYLKLCYLCACRDLQAKATVNGIWQDKQPKENEYNHDIDPFSDEAIASAEAKADLDAGVNTGKIKNKKKEARQYVDFEATMLETASGLNGQPLSLAHDRIHECRRVLAEGMIASIGSPLLKRVWVMVIEQGYDFESVAEELEMSTAVLVRMLRGIGEKITGQSIRSESVLKRKARSEAIDKAISGQIDMFSESAVTFCTEKINKAIVSQKKTNKTINTILKPVSGVSSDSDQMDLFAA